MARFFDITRPRGAVPPRPIFSAPTCAGSMRPSAPPAWRVGDIPASPRVCHPPLQARRAAGRVTGINTSGERCAAVGAVRAGPGREFVRGRAPGSLSSEAATRSRLAERRGQATGKRPPPHHSRRAVMPAPMRRAQRSTAVIGGQFSHPSDACGHRPDGGLTRNWITRESAAIARSPWQPARRVRTWI
jgi:hypothetical protein